MRERRPLLFRLLHETTGVAAVEFAILVALVAGPLMIGLDFGIYQIQKLRLNEAVKEAALVAFQNRNNVDSSQLTNIVKLSWGTGGVAPTVAAECNGSGSCVNTDRPCACITGFVAGAPTFSSISCNATCSNGTDPGYYLTIAANASFSPILSGLVAPPTSIPSTTTVRLQ